jgi:hypothetical protein
VRRLTAAQSSNYHGDAVELQLGNTKNFATARHSALMVGAFDTLVSRIMTFLEERSAETAPFDTEICARMTVWQ